MIDEIQHEVAVHLLANAMRRRRIAAARQGDVPGASAGSRRRSPDDEYLRGMLDLLRALHGRELTERLFREALALEQLDVAG